MSHERKCRSCFIAVVLAQTQGQILDFKKKNLKKKNWERKLCSYEMLLSDNRQVGVTFGDCRCSLDPKKITRHCGQTSPGRRQTTIAPIQCLRFRMVTSRSRSKKCNLTRAILSGVVSAPSVAEVNSQKEMHRMEQ